MRRFVTGPRGWPGAWRPSPAAGQWPRQGGVVHRAEQHGLSTPQLTCHTRSLWFGAWFDGALDRRHGRTSPSGSWDCGGARSAAALRIGTQGRGGRGSTARTPAASGRTASGARSATSRTTPTPMPTPITHSPLRRCDARRVGNARTRSASLTRSSVVEGMPPAARSRCAARFARPARTRARGHVRFVSDVPWSCRSCTLLGGLNSTPP